MNVSANGFLPHIGIQETYDIENMASDTSHVIFPPHCINLKLTAIQKYTPELNMDLGCVNFSQVDFPYCRSKLKLQSGTLGLFLFDRPCGQITCQIFC